MGSGLCQHLWSSWGDGRIAEKDHVRKNNILVLTYNTAGGTVTLSQTQNQREDRFSDIWS